MVQELNQIFCAWNVLQTNYAYDAFNRTIRVEQADRGVVQHGYDPEGSL
ncbi:hypothetical protein WMW72_20485 [Paenibacillus filicis]|uniref:YD repeat-containing protein n=1 Tax=Paenibacillus filicis TaxID=669464 RepID=A0ABU9DPZ8_9BACL